MANHLISFLKKSINVIEKIGETAFFEKFDNLSVELKSSTLHDLAEKIAKDYKVSVKDLICNRNNGNRNLTTPKNIFIYIGNKLDRETLNSFGYDPIRIYHAKIFVNGLLENLTEHKIILDKISLFETSIKN